MLKLDISRAFDSLSWPFLLQVLRKKGFNDKWLCWIAILLSSTSSRVVVNGVPGQKISHASGLWQGDPLPPLLFIMAMDTLTAMFLRATELEILSTLSGVSPIQRLSIFTDDVVLFIRPSRTDLTFVGSALEIFGEALGLSKFHKIFCYPNQVQR